MGKVNRPDNLFRNINNIEQRLSRIERHMFIETWHEVGTGVEPSFLNNWVNWGGNNVTLGFLKDPMGFVHIKGLIKNGTINTAVFLLPVNYRPVKYEEFVCNTSSGLGAIGVDEDGSVLAWVSTNASVTIGGITFKAAE